MMARSGRKLAVVQSPNLPAQGRLTHRYPEPIEQPSRQILQPPSHHAVNRRVWTLLDDRRQRHPMLVR